MSASPSANECFNACVSTIRARIGTLANERMNAELSELLRELGRGVVETGIDISSAPKLEIFDAEDGSVLIEWNFADRRLGFNIEPQEGQSGWYFAFSRNSGGQCGSGLLASLDTKDLLQRMFAKNPTR